MRIVTTPLTVDPNWHAYSGTFILANVRSAVVRNQLALVRDEVDRIHKKFGVQRNLSPDRWNTVLSEEVGEVADAINECDWSNLVVELTQVAAVCVSWLQNISLDTEDGIELTR